MLLAVLLTSKPENANPTAALPLRSALAAALREGTRWCGAKADADDANLGEVLTVGFCSCAAVRSTVGALLERGDRSLGERDRDASTPVDRGEDGCAAISRSNPTFRRNIG